MADATAASFLKAASSHSISPVVKSESIDRQGIASVDWETPYVVDPKAIEAIKNRKVMLASGLIPVIPRDLILNLLRALKDLDSRLRNCARRAFDGFEKTLANSGFSDGNSDGNGDGDFAAGITKLRRRIVRLILRSDTNNPCWLWLVNDAPVWTIQELLTQLENILHKISICTSWQPGTCVKSEQPDQGEQRSHLVPQRAMRCADLAANDQSLQGP